MKGTSFAARALAAWLLLLVVAFHTVAYGQQSPVGQPEPPAQAGEPTPPVSPDVQTRESASKKYLKGIWADQKVIWASPVRMSRRQWISIALPLLASTTALLATDKDAAQWLPNTPDQVKWSKRVSNIGAIYAMGGIVGGTILYGKAKNDSEWSRIGVAASQALIDSVIVSTSLKYMTARERPLENNGQGRFWKGGDSFPSGHAMYSFALATIIARSSRTPLWLKITSCGVAGAVGLSRWGARQHFPSDILVGGVFGGLIGNYVAVRER